MRPRTELRARIREIAHTRIRYGYRRVHMLLGREGWRATTSSSTGCIGKRAWGCAESGPSAMSLRYIGSRVLSRRSPTRPGAWILCPTNSYMARAFGLHQGMPGDRGGSESEGREHVVAVLKSVASERGSPGRIFCDNGSEFVSRALDLWAYVNKVRIDFSRPGKPTDNAHVKSFNGRLREECLNSHWFVSMQDAKQVIDAWRADYNESRPHKALGNRTPQEFVHAASTSARSMGEKEPETLTQPGTKTG